MALIPATDVRIAAAPLNSIVDTEPIGQKRMKWPANIDHVIKLFVGACIQSS
ncbi:hypothetical protein [Providencia rettgeri]